jgi:glycosyltransferase involved in cell wall biosynthesis
VHNGEASLGVCLDAVRRSTHLNFELLVVDDGSSDQSVALAKERGAQVLATGGRRGPAHARNLGAGAAQGDILLFIDADVLIRPDTLQRIDQAFTGDPQLDALIGSYDEDPAAPNFLSQYKNLMHCFVHQHASRRASTFWTGCGAIRRSVFAESRGFDERYTKPSIEDIELGVRLIRQGHKIELDRSLMVKHLKPWTFFKLLQSDFLFRAIPWTMLILRERHMPNDLGVQWTQRMSVALVCLAVALAPFYWPAAVVAVLAVIALNQRFYRFLARRGIFFALRCIPVHLCYFLYSGVGFAVGCMLSLVR